VFEVDDRLGVGLAARLLEDVVLGDPADPYRAAAEGAPDRSRPARWGELFPPELGSDEWLAVQLQLLRRRRAQDEAFEAQLVVELASRRPAAPTAEPTRLVRPPRTPTSRTSSSATSWR
jgi:hypothetical protein